MTQRALIVAARNPWPTRRGDQMRALDFVRALDELGFTVELLVSDHGTAPGDHGPGEVAFFPPTPVDRLRGVASVLRGAPLQTLPFRSAALEQAVCGAMADMDRGDVVLVQLARHGPLLERLYRRRPAEGPVLMVDLIDLLSLNFRRRAQIEGGARGLLWRAEAERLQRVERDVARWSDSVTMVCERDRGELIRREPSAREHTVTTPLPVADSAPGSAAARREGAGGRLVFTGNLGYFVNDHAVRSFLEQAWPRLRIERPGLELVVAGARPGRRLRDACAREGVKLRPNPQDLRGILRSADLALAPLVGGAGVPVKVLEAWSEGVPVVASDWCAEGLLGQGERLEEIDDALFRLPYLDDVDDVVSRILNALDDGEGARARAAAGRQRLHRLHSFVAFRESVERLVRAAERRRSA